MEQSRKRKRKRRGKKNNDPFDSIWNDHFSKIYELLPLENSEMLSYEESVQFYEDLQTAKDELNYTKSLLNNVDIVKWHKHTKAMHLCGNVVPILSRHVNVELVSQAWAKFYTILSSFDFFTNIDLSNVNTVHLCEAPGSFVTSLNHYFCSYYGSSIRWHWCASTLNPYHHGNDTCQMIDDDRFLVETLPYWDFGPDFTGNIMDIDNLHYFEKKFKDVAVSLVTADGSTDCSENPDEQENLVSLLLLWETITALKILSDGGCFVLKIFTIFEKTTFSLVYLLHTFFECVTLMKPGPSKPGNSEVYVVCEGFYEKTCKKSSLFQRFIDAAIKSNITDIDITSTIPKSFMFDILKYVQSSSRKQSQIIKQNLDSFKKDLVRKEELKNMKEYFAKRFLKEFSIYPIQDFVAPLLVLKMKNGLYYNRSAAFNFKRGSFNERIEKHRNQESSNVALKDINGNREKVLMESSDDMKAQLDEITFTPDHTCCCLDSINNFTFVLGKRVSYINSSCFMSSGLLKHYLELKLQHATMESNQTDNDVSYQFEIEKINQSYPSLGLFQKKQIMFLSYSSDSLNVVNYTTLNTEVNKKLENESPKGQENICLKNNIDLLMCDFGCIDIIPKEKSLELMKELLFHIRSSQTVIFRFEGLMLSSFWHGIFFLLTGLFMKVTFIQSKCRADLYYLLFIDCNATSELIKLLHVYIQRLHEEFASLEKTVDILHTVDIYSLMQSNYRKYMIQRNECFAKHFVSKIAKLF